jgi:hypothetical protein
MLLLSQEKKNTKYPTCNPATIYLLAKYSFAYRFLDLFFSSVILQRLFVRNSKIQKRQHSPAMNSIPTVVCNHIRLAR